MGVYVKVDGAIGNRHGEQAGVDLLALQWVVITPKVFDPDVNLRDGYIISMLATRLPVDSGQLQIQLLAALLAFAQDLQPFQARGER